MGDTRSIESNGIQADMLSEASVPALLAIPGVEYLALFEPMSRDRAYECLRTHPTYAHIRLYVRSNGGQVLSEDACSELALVEVDEGFLAIQLSVDLTYDESWYIWQILLLEDFSSGSEFIMLLHMSVGHRMDNLVPESDDSFVPAVVASAHSKAIGEYIGAVRSDCSDGTVSVCDGFQIDMVGYCRAVSSRLGCGSDLDASSLALPQTAVVSFVDLSRDGYCYLRLFSEAYHFRVAAWLGADPLLEDLIDVMLLFRYHDKLSQYDLSHALEQTADGQLHVLSGKLSPLALLFDLIDLWRRGFRGKVGVDVVRGDLEMRSDMDEGTILPRVKELCKVCGFMVNPYMHAQRCKVKCVSHSDEQQALLYSRLSWLGDVRHLADVRQVVLMKGLGLLTTQREMEVQKYTSGKGQASWYSSYRGFKLPALGNSERSLATAFEASYIGRFRHDYLRYLVAQYPMISYAADMSSFMTEDVNLVRECVSEAYMFRRAIDLLDSLAGDPD